MKKVIMFTLMIPAFIGSFIACSGSKMTAGQLDGKWNIVEVKGEKVKAEKTPFMEFNMKENKLHGNAGCNIFNTSVEVDAKDQTAITINEGMSTMMSCPDMETETKILQSLQSVKAVKAGNNSNEAQLVDASGNVIFLLTK